MKKTAYIAYLLILSISSFSQSIEKPDSVFVIDTPFVFNHYTDFIITKEFTLFKKGRTLDTVYSAQFNNEGKLCAELIDRDVIYINRFEYDSLGRKCKTKTYRKSQFHGENGLNEITIQLFFYNSFDSISVIENYVSYPKRKENIVKEEQEKMEQMTSLEELWSMKQRYSDYTNEWEWSYSGVFKNYYDSKNNRISAKFYDTRDFDSKWDFKYDSLNRITYEFWCQHSFNNDLTRDTNSCQMGHEKYFNYNDSMKVAVDTNYFGASMTVTEVKTKYNRNGGIQNIIESWKQYDRTKNYELYETGQHETKYIYDNKGRIEQRLEYYKNESEPTIYRYIYNKNNSG